jgi:hypothetical protein
MRVPHPRERVGTRGPSERSSETTFVEHEPHYPVQPSIREDVVMEGTTEGTHFRRNRYATQEPTSCVRRLARGATTDRK